jgi:hypothetical protein
VRFKAADLRPLFKESAGNGNETMELIIDEFVKTKKLTQRRKESYFKNNKLTLRLCVFGVLFRALICVENDFLRDYQ